jgi:mannose-1-phosphate guanylyltransferase/mannose-6-phosphate isomerase
VRASDVIAGFEAHAPELLAPCRSAIAAGGPDLGFFRLDAEAYGAAPAISFDYAVMEKPRRVMAVPLDCGWSDLGAWDALWQVVDKDADGVATSGPVTASTAATPTCGPRMRAMQLVGLGLEGVVAVAMRDAVLVADKTRAQDVKAVVRPRAARRSPRPTITPASTAPGAGTRRCAWTPGSR